MTTRTTDSPYFLLFMRHIDDLDQRLTDELAPKYIDVMVEDNSIRMIDRFKTRRLQALKVYRCLVLHALSSLLFLSESFGSWYIK